jgi:hypothetical protein
MLRDNDGHEDQSGLLENLTLAYRVSVNYLLTGRAIASTDSYWRVKQLETKPEYTDDIVPDHATGASLFQATGAIILPPTVEDEILAKTAVFSEPSEISTMYSPNDGQKTFAVGVGGKLGAQFDELVD